MSHPKVCPCPNCLGSGSGAGWFFLAAGAAVAVFVAVKLAEFSAWAGRAPFLIVGAVVGTGVIAALVLMIRGAVANARTAPVAEPKMTQSDSPEPEVPALPAERPRLRLVRDQEVA